MKTIVTTVLLFSLSFLQAQNTNSANRNRNADSLPPETIAKALAQIAIENNGVGVQEAVTKASEYNYKAQKTSWLDNFRASGNINSFTNNNNTINGITGQAFYPRYNIGVSLPFGIFVNLPKQTKASFYNYQAQLENLRMAKQDLQLQVISLYYNYVRTQKLYQLQEESLQDTEFATKKTEERFGKGEVNLDVYTAATKRYNDEQGAKVSLERDLMIGKAQLEMLLGMPLETALVNVRTTRRNVSPRR